MDFDKYKNKLPYSSSKKDPEISKAYHEEERRLHDLFVEDLFKELGIENHPKRHTLLRLAWAEGHSSGYSEVYHYASEFAELLS